jgi:type III secretory pathway component EscR
MRKSRETYERKLRKQLFWLVFNMSELLILIVTASASYIYKPHLLAARNRSVGLVKSDPNVALYEWSLVLEARVPA